MSNRKDLADKIRQKFGGQVEVWPDQDEVDPDKPTLVPNRRERRLLGKERGKGGTGKVHDALRLGARPGRAGRRTGRPFWFRQMKYEEQRRKALEKVDLLRLEPAVGPVVRDLYYVGGYKNVWQLSQVADVDELLKVGRQTDLAKSVRIQELKKIRTYLVNQRVPVKWEV